MKRGDLSGLEFLVRKYQTKAVYAAYLVLQDRQSAEDVVQSAFLRVYERIGQFDASRPFEPWFIRSVVNGALDAARRSNRLVPLEPDTGAGEWVEWLASDGPSPQDLVETAEMRAAVRRTLRQLSADQRAAIVLRYFLEMNEAEMVAALQRPPSTVKWHLHEARRRLRELLRPPARPPADEPREESGL